MNSNQLEQKIIQLDESYNTKVDQIDKNGGITTNEKNLVIERIFPLSDDFLYYYELPSPNEYSLSICKEQINTFSEKSYKIDLVIDLTVVNKTSALLRNKISEIFPFDKIRSIYLYPEDNILLQVAAQFILKTVKKDNNYKIITNRMEAFNYVKSK